MSRKDPRKGIALSLREDDRLLLVSGCENRRPLPGLMRKALIRGLAAGWDSGADGQCRIERAGSARPVTLQLAARERAKLAEFAAHHGMETGAAALALIHIGLQAPCDPAQTGLAEAHDRTN